MLWNFRERRVCRLEPFLLRNYNLGYRKEKESSGIVVSCTDTEIKVTLGAV